MLNNWTALPGNSANMNLFDIHCGKEVSPAFFIKGIYWEASLFLRKRIFTEGCAGANNKASPPLAVNQRCTFRPAAFSSVASTRIALSVGLRLENLWRIIISYFFLHRSAVWFKCTDLASLTDVASWHLSTLAQLPL